MTPRPPRLRFRFGNDFRNPITPKNTEYVRPTTHWAIFDIFLRIPRRNIQGNDDLLTTSSAAITPLLLHRVIHHLLAPVIQPQKTVPSLQPESPEAFLMRSTYK